MKKILILFLLLTSFSFAQQLKLWINEDVEEDAAGYIESKSHHISDDFKTFGDFFGLVSIYLNVDSSTTLRNNRDSLYFKPMLKFGETWYLGDTLHWKRFDTADITSSIIQSNLTYIIPGVVHDSLLVWFNDPTDTSTIWGLPASQTDFKLRCYFISDSVNFIIKDSKLGVH